MVVVEAEEDTEVVMAVVMEADMEAEADTEVIKFWEYYNHFQFKICCLVDD